jgi:2-hydroxycyclohexanecarboxyl-CoA dehydrogenase
VSFDHRDRVVAVTGAASGIGRATARRLAAEGAGVAVLDVDRPGASETVELVEAAGGRALACEVDVRDRGSVRAARDAIDDEFGRLTGLVNCAGVVTMSGLDDLTDDEWDFVVDVNLKGTWLVTQELAPTIARAGGGAVVNLSTVEAEVVVSSTGRAQVHYNASKGGVKMLTKALAVELAGRDIRVNCVAPGPVATDFVSLEAMMSPEAQEFMRPRLLVPRVGQPEDIAAAISFLLSDDASWITGAQLPVDGGWLAQ